MATPKTPTGADGAMNSPHRGSVVDVGPINAARKDRAMMVSGQKCRVRCARTAARVLYATVLILWSPPLTSAQAPLVDLEGYWNLGTLTPLQRPAEFKGKTTLSIDDATEYERTQFERRLQVNGDECQRLQADANDTWNEILAVDRRRTALITDPSEGRLPPSAMNSGAAGAPPAPLRYDNPEDIELVARWLIATRGTTSQASPPMIPNTVFSPFYQIVRTADDDRQH